MDQTNTADSQTTNAEHVPPPTIRFSLIHLLYLVTLLAAAFALFELYALVWLGVVLLFWGIVYVLRTSSSITGIILFVLFGSMIVCCMGLPAVQSVREAARRTICTNQVRQLGLSLLNYESAFAAFPPAYQSDHEGKPMHSWRVLILPYLEQQTIYNQYDFSQSWNGPNNKKLANQLPQDWTYFCPLQSDHQFKTPYKLVTGKGTAFDADQPAALNTIASVSNTIAIVEDLSDPVDWMEPRDLTVEGAVKLFDVNQEILPECVVETKFSRTIFYHRSVALFDGSVQSVGYLEDPEQIIPYLLLNHPDKKEIFDLKFVYPKPTRTVLYSGYFLLGVNILLALLPCFWAKLRPFENIDSK